jgi:hypothetical protein
MRRPISEPEWCACDHGRAAVAVAAIGLRVPGGWPAADAVAFALAIAWALAAIAGPVAAHHRALGQLSLGLLAALGALAAATALTAARIAAHDGTAVGSRQAARAVATLAVPLVIAISVHLLLGLPDGRLGSRGRRIGAGLAFAAPLGSRRSALAVAGRPVPVRRWPRSSGRWPRRARCRPCGLRYLVSGPGPGTDAVDGRRRRAGGRLGPDRRRPAPARRLARTRRRRGGRRCDLPPARHDGRGAARAGAVGGRVLVHVLSIAGFSAGRRGHLPGHRARHRHGARDAADRGVLGLSMLAAAVAAIGYLPARDRLAASATRFVYGAKEAPDEALRTFGSRLTRAVPWTSCCCSWPSRCARPWADQSRGLHRHRRRAGARGVSARRRTRSIVVTPRERPVVTRAGVSGSAWASVWLPGAAGRPRAGPAAGGAGQPRRRAARPDRRRTARHRGQPSPRMTTAC